MSAEPDRSYRVLLVDDDEQVRKMYRRALQRHRFDVEVAVDGAEALALLSTQSCCLDWTSAS